MIRFEGVSKSYPTKSGRKYTLRDVDFTIPKGVNVGVLGRNGAGKSTLLRLMSRSDYPDKGRIICDGSVSWPVGLGAAYQGSLSARENTRFVGRIHGVSDLGRLESFVKDFGELKEYFEMPINTYSSGMRSRFTFALSMAFDFDIYLIDEVTAVGDASFRARCQQSLESKTRARQIIMVSHNLSEIQRLCHAGVLLENGTFRYFEDIHEAISTYKAGMT